MVKLVQFSTEDEEDFDLETREASPAHLLVKINSFSLLEEHGIDEFESREFVAGDHRWKLMIYPNGDKGGDHMSVYLTMAGASSLPGDWELHAMFTIFLFNQISDNYTCYREKVRRFHPMNPVWGFPKLISKKRLKEPSNGYLVDDMCVLGAEVFVIRGQRLIQGLSLYRIKKPCNHNFVISGYSKLKDLWTSEEFMAGGYKWMVLVYPNGKEGGVKGRSVSMFMECVDSKKFGAHQKIKAHFVMRIKNKNHDKSHSYKYSHWFSSYEILRGHYDFIAISDMRDVTKGFVVNDSCILETEVSVIAVSM